MKQEVYRLPEEFLSRLKQIYPHNYNNICSSFASKKAQSFRINYLKTDLRSLRRKLIEEHIKARELEWPPGAFILKSDMRRFQNTSIYREGLVYVQNISSMIPPLILRPQKGEKILDLCAAPGAKTTQIASLVKEETEIVAVEKIRTRYYKLLANLKIQGASFVKAILLDGVLVRKKFYDYFDKVLLDAPCSAEGKFYIKNPRSFKYWKYRKVKEMAHKQKRLFSSAFCALKEGGILVYSTCTFSPEENEEIVDWALDKFKDNISLFPVEVPFKNIKRGLLRWRKKKFSLSLDLTLRIIPTDYMEGFFIACFKKVPS